MSDMSAGSAMGSPLSRNGIEFPRLLTEDYGTLEDIVRDRRGRLIRTQLDECQIKGTDKFLALRQQESFDVSFSEVDQYLCTRDGAKKAFALSLKRAGKTESESNAVFSALPIVDATRIARELVGFIEDPIPQELRDIIAGWSQLTDDGQKSVSRAYASAERKPPLP